MSINRQKGITALSHALKQQKNCETFEKYIYNHVYEHKSEDDSPLLQQKYFTLDHFWGYDRLVFVNIQSILIRYLWFATM